MEFISPNCIKQLRLKDTLQFIEVGGQIDRLTKKYDTSAEEN